MALILRSAGSPLTNDQIDGNFTYLDTIKAPLASPTFTGTVTATTFAGNSSTTTKLATAVTINGTSFDGSANITVTTPISTGVSGLATGVATFLATPSSANLISSITDETGTGVLVFNISPAITASLTTPSTSFALLNTTATTVNFAGAATTLTMGASTGTSTINNDLVISGNLTVNGLTTTINTSTLAIDDKNIELGSAPSASISATGTVGTITGSGPWAAIVTGMVSTTGLIVGSSLVAVTGTGSLGGSGSYIVTSIDSKTQVSYSATGGTTPTAGTITTITTAGYNDITANGAGITVKGITDKTLNWVGSTTAWTSSENLDIVSGKSYSINGTNVLSSSTLGSGVTASSLTSVGTLVNLVYSNTLTSTVATGTAPFIVTSTTAVANLSIGGTAALATSLVGGLIGSIPYQSAVNTTALLANGTTGQVLTATTGGAPTWATATAASSLSGGLIGSIPYQSAVNTTAMLANGTTGQILTATSGGAPTWAAAPASGATITDDITTNVNQYLGMSRSTSGAWLNAYTASTELFFNPYNSTLYSTVFQSLSDKNKKTNINTIENALDIVENINGVTFDWIDSGLPSAGLIAQDVEKYLPELISTAEGTKSLNYNGVIGVLVEAIKELSEKIRVLESK